MRDEDLIGKIAENCKLLYDGYFEDVEYSVTVNGEREKRARRIRRPGYLEQLRDFAKHKDVDRNSKAVRGAPRVKAAGRAPGDVAGFMVLDELQRSILEQDRHLGSDHDLGPRSLIKVQDQRSCFQDQRSWSKINDLGLQDQRSRSGLKINDQGQAEDQRSPKINDLVEGRRSCDLKINDLGIDQLECEIPHTVDKILDVAGRDRTWACASVKTILMGLPHQASYLMDDGKHDLARDILRETETWVRKAKATLKISVADTMFTDTVCGTCGGALTIAADNSTEVRCIGSPDAPPCGQTYGPSDWLNLLKANADA